MRLLLDTNAIIHVRQDWPGFGAETKALLADPANVVYMSSVSVAEIAIKVSIGKLDALPEPLTDVMKQLRWTELPFTVAHAERMSELPWHHRDPFDRMLIAQALVEGLPVVTSDRRFADYGVHVL